MLARWFAIAATVASIACPRSKPGPESPRPVVDDTALRTRVALAEARRGGGLGELAELARHGRKPERVLALRGLGRIGGGQALDALRGALGDPDADVVAAAAGGIGVAASLDELDPAATAAVTAALIEALQRAPVPPRGPADAAATALIAEALGRAGDASAHPVLRAGLDREPAIAAACATALGRHGRRKIALSAEARDGLAGAIIHRTADVRAAAVWALARAHLPAADPKDEARSVELARRLAAALHDDHPEVRAQAVVALARHQLVRAARPELVQALRDPDWRVAVEALRAVTGDGSDAAGRIAAAASLDGRFARLEAGDPIEAQVVIEGLRGLIATTDDGAPEVSAEIGLALSSVSDRAVRSKLSPLARGWIDCLAQVARAKRGTLGTKPVSYAEVEQCGRGGLPDHLRLPLLVELIKAGRGPVAVRRGALTRLLSHGDVRVRAAGMAALAPLWHDGDAADHRATIASLIAGIGAADPILAGASVEAAPAIYAVIEDGDRSALDAAIVARARTEHDVELAGSLFELIGKRTLAAGAGACRDGLIGHPVRATAAAACLTALGVAAPSERPVAAATAPPVDVAAVIGKRVRWRLTTSRGALVIELRPDVAPWAVATIVELTRKGYYDGLELHRVVPDFVVQGGDPTQSGWGGPGFVIPAEPATSADGPGFVAGGVGIADAGRDSGGSQWFIMHARAAHLDGRYTWIGSIDAPSQKSADGLLIGDRVVKAVVEVGPR